MRRLLALGALALLVLPATAQARTSLIYSDGSPAPLLQGWADSSYAPLVEGVVTIHRAACFNGAAGSCTVAPGDEVWLRDRPDALRGALMHELGHRFDYLRMTDSARAAFGLLVHDYRPWRTSPNSPHEKFAEAFGTCSRHRMLRGPLANVFYDYAPGPVRHRRVCRLIRQVDAGVFG